METGISDKELIQIREQMLKFATLQVSNPVLAEDLVQESFLSAFNHLEQFKRQAAFKTWVFAILKNKIIDFLRQKGKLILETEIEDEEQTNHFFDEGGHWKAEHSPLDLELSESAVKNAWGLREKDSVIILLDKTGKVQFVKEGKLTDDEVKEVISRVTALIAK